MKKRYHIILVACIILAIGIPASLMSDAAPPQGDVHIFLLGTHHTWSNNGDAGFFDRGSPGSTQEVVFRYNLAQSAGVHPSEINVNRIQVRPYDAGNPEWSDWTSSNFRYNATRMMGTNASAHKNMFAREYWRYTSNSIEFVQIGGQAFHYNPTTGELTFRMRYSLNTPMGKFSYPMHDLLIRDGEAGLQAILSMIGDVQPPEVMNRLREGVNHGNPNLRGYLYFMPHVITYNTGTEQDMGMVDVTLQNSSGQSVSYLRPGEGHTVSFFTRHVLGGIPVGLDPLRNPMTTIDVTITDRNNRTIHRQTHQAREVLQPNGTIGINVFPVCYRNKVYGTWMKVEQGTTVFDTQKC